MFLIQVLLPRRAGGGAIDEAAFARTREELADAFDGVTAYLRSPAEGVWIAPEGRKERDDVVMVEVLAPVFDRGWWRAYAATLATRFRQEAIHVRALPAATP